MSCNVIRRYLISARLVFRIIRLRCRLRSISLFSGQYWDFRTFGQYWEIQHKCSFANAFMIACELNEGNIELCLTVQKIAYAL